MGQESEQLPGQMSIFDLMTGPAEPELNNGPLSSFAAYIGQCQYCMWFGYGLFEPYGHKRKPGTEGQMCQWAKSKLNGCKNHSMWKPGEFAIPGLCANCAWSNCFHYQKKAQYKDYDAKAFADPVEEPNIYCTREDGSVNRTYPFKDFYEHGFGACKWDRQHEWDSCDAWQSDGWRLKGGHDEENPR